MIDKILRHIKEWLLVYVLLITLVPLLALGTISANKSEVERVEQVQLFMDRLDTIVDKLDSNTRTLDEFNQILLGVNQG